MTPFEALYGYKPSQPPYHNYGATTDETVKDFLQECVQRVQLIRFHL